LQFERATLDNRRTDHRCRAAAEEHRGRLMTTLWRISKGAPGRRAVAAAVLWCAAGLAFAQSADLPNRKDPLPGITTAGQPSADAIAAAAKAGVKTVIDLRGANEDRGMDEKATVEKLGMSYVTLPVEGANGVTFGNAKTLDQLLKDAPGPVLIHCASGNRVGALLALRAEMNGTKADDALALGVASGLTGLKPAVQQKLAAGHD
jgi:uncharacterized protein (TIGR01244 family)